MESIRQRCRPKHQVLILKTYPRFQKNWNAAEVKPNSSECSYLLYYCSTRPGKLQKVASFLERKTASDLYRTRIGNVQITLQILSSLIQKCPRDLPLYSSSVLAILAAALESHDITLLEESIATFEAFCHHYHASTLAADHDHSRKYDNVVNLYASYASKESATQTKDSTNVPMTLRYRNAGLRAIKGLVGAEAFASDSGRQLKPVISSILDNLYSDEPRHLANLQYAENSKSVSDQEPSLKERQSVNLARNTDSEEADPSIATGTAEDVDLKASETVGILALQCLRDIFSTENRSQFRIATNLVLSFICRSSQTDLNASDTEKTSLSSTWATEIFECICRWTPVQDRFIILVTATEYFSRSSNSEHNLPNQLILVRIINSLLRSTINFIGLSVIDILVSFIHVVLSLLQLGSTRPRSSLRPHADSLASRIPSPADEKAANGALSTVQTASSLRKQLLEELQGTIAGLAIHTYYSDQIGDMISTLLMRLKPHSPHGVAATASAIQNPSRAAGTIADSANLQETPDTDDFFSFSTARLIALSAVKKILVVVNTQRKSGTSTTEQNRVDVMSWDGTQWLLRDPNGQVRKAYVEALLTWMELELNRKNLRIPQEDHQRTKRHQRDVNGNATFARRAISNASRSSNSNLNLRTHSTFLQLLHLAIYENALEHGRDTSDLLLLHLLLTQLVKKLGVNSARHGLPMIFRLQEDIRSIADPAQKDAIGSLVHGYLWGISRFFDFENNTETGRIITTEIRRRMKVGLWIQGIQIPPIGLEHIGQPGMSSVQPVAHAMSTPDNSVLDPAGRSDIVGLKPFTMREDLIDCIAEAYAGSATPMLSPPTSPPTSPGPANWRPRTPSRNPSSFAFEVSSYEQLPQSIREQLMSAWSREGCIAIAEKASRAGTAGSLTETGTGSGSKKRNENRMSNRPAQNHNHFLEVNNGGMSGLAATGGVDKEGAYGMTQQRESNSSHNSDEPTSDAEIVDDEDDEGAGNRTVHVSDLKRILETGHDPMTARREEVRKKRESTMADIPEATRKRSTGTANGKDVRRQSSEESMVSASEFGGQRREQET